MTKTVIVLSAEEAIYTVNRESREVFLEFRLAPMSAPFLPDHKLVLGMSASEARDIALTLVRMAAEAEGAGPPN